jgi:acyl dehydratase
MGEAGGRKLKEGLYELVEVGEEFGPIEEVITDHKIKAYAFSVDDYHPWSFGESSAFGKRIGQAALLANDLLATFLTVYDANTVVGLHTEEQLWFHNPVFAGERVTLTGKYVDKYERRGKGHVVLEAEARGEDGRLLLRHRGVEIMRIQPGPVVGSRTAEAPERRVTGEYRRDVAPAATARLGLEPRTPIAPCVKQVRHEQMAVFSGVGKHRRNIHTDIEVARKGGLDRTLAQGMMETCYLTEMAARFFGAAWFTSGWERMKFISPVYDGDTVTIRGAVLEETKEKDGTRLHLEIWIENQDGKMTAAGWASALVEG